MPWNTNLPASVAVGTLLTPSNFMNPVVENIAYLLAPNYFLTIKKGPAITYTTTSTSFVDVHTDFSHTITMNGGHLIMMVEGVLRNVGGASYYAYLDININGSRVGDSTYGLYWVFGGDDDFRSRMSIAWVIPSGTIGTGSKTVKLQFKTSNSGYAAQYTTTTLGNFPIMFFGAEL